MEAFMPNRPHRRRRRGLVAGGLALTLILPALFPAVAVAAPDNVLTKVTIPFSGTVFDADTNENVDVAGQLLVKIAIYYKLTPTRIRAQYKLANDATAVGETSAAAYQTIGHDAVKFFWAAGQVVTVDQLAVLRLAPAGIALHPNHSDTTNPQVRIWQLRYRIDYGPGNDVTAMSATVEPDPGPASCTAVMNVCNP